MDKIILTGKLNEFCRVLEHQQPLGPPGVTKKFGHNIGYKYARIYSYYQPGQDTVQYFVDTRSGDIYESKSWTQANTRRWFGTLDTISEWNWAYHPANALPGTPSEQAYHKREAEIKESYQTRGRKPKGT